MGAQRIGSVTRAAILAAAIAAAVSPVQAQYLAEQQAAMNVADTLSGASVGPAPSTYFAQPGMQQPGMMQPGMMQPGMMQPGMMQPGMNPYAAIGGQPMAPVATPAPPPVRQILVLTGQRVTCKVTGQLLEDIHYEYRPEVEKSNFYDDGQQGGDLQANDNIWTNFTEFNDVLSPEANRFKLIYLRLLSICENTNPLEFFRIPVATDEPLTPLPLLSAEEANRDKTFLQEWHKRFLALYRVDPDDPMSDFYPIFVPSPPRHPESPAPPDDQFNAYAFALDAWIQNALDAQIVPPEPQGQTAGGQGGTGQTARRAAGGTARGRTGGSQAVVSDRWGQLRQDARTLGATYGTYQTSSYFAY